MNFRFIEKLKTNKVISYFLSKLVTEQFIRYLIVGFSTAALELLLFYTLSIFMSVVISNTIAQTVVFWCNFLLNKMWSFKSNDSLLRQLLFYGMLFLFNLGVADGIIYFLTGTLSVHKLLAKVFVMGLIVCWNYIIYRKIIFKTSV